MFNVQTDLNMAFDVLYMNILFMNIRYTASFVVGCD